MTEASEASGQGSPEASGQGSPEPSGQGSPGASGRPEPSGPRSYRLFRGDRLVLELRGEPGILVSTSAPPPLPGAGPVTHPFATATFHTAETEGELGALLRGASDLDAFLVAAEQAGYRVERVG
ncbi:hypothetical protein [Agromyces larvae]|uniref:Uncharacterized protein n=1 Tax=Agromyces larvae TaxID=2929802 RepID=A0ABY4BTY3_9MICO|nr:hypothetical protein [Agromyces larvae]UOE42681.1 hypothetical protein MTO99_10790 [Agromyces larvae]